LLYTLKYKPLKIISIPFFSFISIFFTCANIFAPQHHFIYCWMIVVFV
jgi:hypothetical protein